jgi:hypothetical protein
MVHSLELLFDADTDAAIRRDWAALAEAGLPSHGAIRAGTNRPHVTLAVSAHLDPAVDHALAAALGRLPLDCRVGAPMIFGGRTLTLVRLIVPSLGLLDLQATVDAAAVPFMRPGAMPHSQPGQWTPHVTLCRRLAPADLASALAAISHADHAGTFTGMRRWNGDAHTEHLLAAG